MVWGLITAVAAVGFSAQDALAATTRVVGSLKSATGTELCQPTVSKANRFTTIQAAVDASIAGAVPSTIWVCPGRYPEQVHIYNTATYSPIITLKGSNLTSGPAVIAAPIAPWVPYQSAIYGWVVPQLLVTDTTGVTINNLEIDGTGGCPVVDGVSTPPLMAGVMFANNGDPATSATEAGIVRFVNVHDQLPVYDPACGLSAGILAENAYIQINDNNIRNVNYSGILEYGGNATMLRNTISYPGYTAIRSTAAHPVDVSLNVIANTYFGILLENGTNAVQVDKNSFSPTVTTAIYLHGAHDNFIRSNTINNPWTGIALDGGFPQIDPASPSSGNLVTGNVISNCGYACITDSWSAGTNRISGNTLSNSAAYGIWLWNVADFLENGTAPAPPPPPFLDWDSIYSNSNVGIPLKICHASYVDGVGWSCAAGDQ
jgi:hypothetical protein